MSRTRTLRLRAHGHSGFLFFNNHHCTSAWPARNGVQFALQFEAGTQLVPREPLDIPAGAYGFWPVNLDCAGVRLDYATAQLISRLEVAGDYRFFFTANEGIKPEFGFVGEKPRRCKPGLGIAFTRKNRDDAKVNFVVLSADQGRQFWELPLAGRDRKISQWKIDANPQQSLTSQKPLSEHPLLQPVGCGGRTGGWLTYNLWSLFTRLMGLNSGHHSEAIKSRRDFLFLAAQVVASERQRTVKLAIKAEW